MKNDNKIHYKWFNSGGDKQAGAKIVDFVNKHNLKIIAISGEVRYLGLALFFKFK